MGVRMALARPLAVVALGPKVVRGVLATRASVNTQGRKTEGTERCGSSMFSGKRLKTWQFISCNRCDVQRRWCPRAPTACACHVGPLEACCFPSPLGLIVWG